MTATPSPDSRATTPALMSKNDVCARLNLSLRTLENLVRRGEFPPPVRLGKMKYWSERAVETWLRTMLAPQERWHL